MVFLWDAKYGKEKVVSVNLRLLSSLLFQIAMVHPPAMVFAVITNIRADCKRKKRKLPHRLYCACDDGSPDIYSNERLQNGGRDARSVTRQEI